MNICEKLMSVIYEFINGYGDGGHTCILSVDED